MYSTDATHMKSKQLPNANIESLEITPVLPMPPRNYGLGAKKKEEGAIEKLSFVGVIKFNYSVRYAFSRSDGAYFEMAAKDFYAVIPYMNKGKVVGRFRYVNSRGRPGIVFVEK